MSPFERFPNEICVEILSCLCSHDLASTSRISHHLHAISQPLLYKEPYLSTDSQYPSPLYIFLRTLLTPGREGLAAHVRSLTLHWHDPESEPPERESDIALLTAAASRLGLDRPLASEGAQVVLLMHLLPRLETLNVMPPDERDDFDDLMEAHHVLQPTVSLPLALQSLRDFHWYSRTGESSETPKLFSTLMRLPCIHTVSLHMMHKTVISFPGVDAPTGATTTTAATTATTTATSTSTSTVTHLELWFGNLSPWSLGCILKLTHALTHFSYRTLRGLSDFSGFAAALQPLQNSLRHLQLDLFWLPDSSWVWTETSTALGSLREWPVLRSLRISLVILLGKALQGEPRLLAHMLPKSLFVLDVLKDHCWSAAEVVDELVAMLEQKEAMLPGLRRVAVVRAFCKSPEMVERLDAACKAVAVEHVKDRSQMVYC